ncbi:ATP-binding protein [bacterium]|nr:ATP-binding protein [bacterium]
MKESDALRIKKSTGLLSIHAPGDGSYLSHIRRLVTDLARQVGFHEEEVAKIEMAVDEACSNVVEHAYAPNKQWRWQHREPELRMAIRIQDGQLVIEINDHGQRFDFTNYRPANLEDNLRDMRPGGYGIVIMRKFMDEVQYNSSDETGNTLRLVKYLKKA